jgi:hypothetical protein
MIIDQQFAQQFTTEWINCWNTRDMDRLMAHYANDFSIETPYALKVYPDSGGIIKGKNNVRLYWDTALSRISELRFTALGTFTGINSISIYYHSSASNANVIENLFFNEDGKVNKVCVMYS